MQEGRNGRPPKSANWLCDTCVSTDGYLKKTYPSRKTARRARRMTSGGGLSVFECPHHPGWWHVGHLPRVVRVGRAHRREIYRRRGY